MPALLGQHLKAAREQRGLSLSDASHETRIPTGRLMLLEQDNYAAFGSMTYARAFLRQYSDYLQVDAQGVLDELPGAVLGGPRDYRYLTENHGPWVLPRGSSFSQDSSRLTPPRRTPMVAGLATFILMLIGSGIWGHYALSERQNAARPLLPAVEGPPQGLATSAGVNPQLPMAMRIVKAIPVPERDDEKVIAGNTGGME
jgi:cytoskeletal protein RodZ